MTIAGLALVVIGAIVGLSGTVPYNGQWLLGLLITIVGFALVTRHSSKEKK